MVKPRSSDRARVVGCSIVVATFGGLLTLAVGALPAAAQGGVPTQTLVTSSLNPSVSAKPSPTFTATVSESDGGDAGVPTGTVTFMVETAFGKFQTYICTNGGQSTKKLVDGSASCATHLFGTGSPYTVTVVYSGDATFAPSTSNALVQEVDPGPSLTTVSARPPAPAPGRQVRLTAFVVGSPVPIAGHRTVYVTFSVTGADHSVLTCVGGDQVPISLGGRATCVVAKDQLSASASPYSVVADYSGDVNFQASSGNLTLTLSS